MLSLIDQITQQKNFTLCLFQAVHRLVKNNKLKIEILHLTYHKIVLKLNNDLVLSFIIRFSNSELLRVILVP